MNIGITTFQWSDNYGAVLQAHALYSFLKQKGNTVQIIDYRPNDSSMPFFRKWVARTPRRCVRKWEVIYKKHLFESFRSKYLGRTPEIYHSIPDLTPISDCFDMLITGSDQVWNPQWLSQFEDLFNLYFLSFAGSNTQRISYAASFGHSKKDTINDNWYPLFREMLLKMNLISVREPSGVELVRELCGRKDALQVVDPTLLMERFYYEKMAGSKRKRRGYLFSYMLHGMERDAERVNRRISETLNLKVLKCDARKTGLHAGYSFPSPTGWLRRIRDASFVVTNSFHGMVFCLIFHTPFVALLIDGQIGSMNSRIVELLNVVGLTHRVVSSRNNISDNLCNEIICWNSVDQLISDMRRNSLAFLNELSFNDNV